MSKKFEVQTHTIYGDWVNCWHDGDEMLYFNTRKEAQAAIDEFIEVTKIAVAEGYLTDAHTKDDYKIVEVIL